MYDRERHVAIFAARRAGLVADEYSTTDMRTADGTAEKTDATDLVTEGDRRAQRAVVETIRKHFPDDRITAEEELDDTGDPDSDREWVIDPIDGTTNFSTGLPLYNTAIAFREGGETKVGVVLSPRSSLGRLWFAVRGEGAETTTLDGQPRQIEVSDHDELDGSVITTLDVSLDDDALVNRRRLGSCALTLGLVAEGRLDAYAIDYPLAEWDWEAGKLIVEEAGGRFTLDGDLLVASNGTAIHDRIIDLQ